MMNALAALFAAPAAEAALGLARSGAAAVAQPFDLLLKAAAERAEGASSDSRDRDENEEGESIRERLAGKLQELMTAIGGAAGDAVTLRLDEITGAVQVGDDHPLAETLEAEFANDPEIAADLARLAELEGDDAEWQFEPAA